MNGSYFFDDEGWSAAPTQIVKDGVYVQPLTDQYTAAVGKITRTANGRRQDYAHKAYSRMSNTFFGEGTTPAAEVLSAAGDGILIDGFGSGMEDPHGWGIQLVCRMGYEFKGGEFTGQVFAPVTVTGYVPDILESITHVGDRLSMVPGTCGKGHKELVPVAIGGPHLVFTAQLG
jgi:TldD protein